MVFQKGHHLSVGRPAGGKNQKTLALLERWNEELDRIFEAMKGKTIADEGYADLMTAADKAQKNIQLLGGDPTERQEIVGVEISVRK